MANIAGDVLSCMEWLNLTIMANFYPGAPNDREVSVAAKDKVKRRFKCCVDYGTRNAPMRAQRNHG